MKTELLYLDACPSYKQTWPAGGLAPLAARWRQWSRLGLTKEEPHDEGDTCGGRTDGDGFENGCLPVSS